MAVCIIVNACTCIYVLDIYIYVYIYVLTHHIYMLFCQKKKI